jgi:hypothetical protein
LHNSLDAISVGACCGSNRIKIQSEHRSVDNEPGYGVDGRDDSFKP